MMRLQKVTPVSNCQIYFFALHFTYSLMPVFDMCAISADIISCVEFNHDGDLLATGDKGGRVVIFQRDPVVSFTSVCMIVIGILLFTILVFFAVQNFST